MLQRSACREASIANIHLRYRGTTDGLFQEPGAFRARECHRNVQRTAYQNPRRTDDSPIPSDPKCDIPSRCRLWSSGRPQTLRPVKEARLPGETSLLELRVGHVLLDAHQPPLKYRRQKLSGPLYIAATHPFQQQLAQVESKSRGWPQPGADAALDIKHCTKDLSIGSSRRRRDRVDLSKQPKSERVGDQDVIA